MIALGYGKRSGEAVLVCDVQGGELPDARASVQGMLVSRLDFDVQVLDIPAVPEKEVEGLIRYRLRSIYPGNPAETAFDFRLETDGKHTRAVVFIAKSTILDVYRNAAGEKPLFLPYCLYADMAKKSRDCRVWFHHREWMEQALFRNGLPVSCSVKRRGKAETADTPWDESDWAEDLRELPVTVIAPAADLPGIRESLPDDVAPRATLLGVLDLVASQKKPRGVFAPRRRRSALLGPSVRIALWAACAVTLGILLFSKYVAGVESEYQELKARYNALEARTRTVLTLQKEVVDLNAEIAALQAEKPRDLYAFLSELSSVLGREARISRLTFQGEAFQIEAIGTNPLRLMEGFRDRPSFRNVRLAQVVPDAGSGKERFSFSGVFRAH